MGIEGKGWMGWTEMEGRIDGERLRVITLGQVHVPSQTLPFLTLCIPILLFTSHPSPRSLPPPVASSHLEVHAGVEPVRLRARVAEEATLVQLLGHLQGHEMRWE